ncbi:MAG: hypothetical protein HKN88_06205 [Gammaproteobacteria bacterium]|nr:hypothetical protein [Gammaproteobacteria bacterium]NNC97649.1 hypothetical protein [Gammaproteobacteria bacterium]NNM13202.1 hypothetical protein [Gammaproteobacteria bacterium]
MRFLVLLYGIVSYLAFLLVFVYFIAFVGEFYVPKTLSSEVKMSTTSALLVNIGLLILWGVQHTLMAREKFKQAISALIPHHIERSTYVLVSSITLAILIHFWQPMHGTLWSLENASWIWVIFFTGWGLVFIATFLTDHFDLFGLRQTWLHYVKKSYTSVEFTERLFYKWIRHPMMLGLILAFWAIPIMTTGHLVFAIGMSVYILVGIHFEEKGLAKHLGIDYQDYQKRTARIFPKIF